MSALSPSEPDFVSSFSIPDTHSPDDDKIYFFFKEKAVEAEQWDRRVYSRVARVCKVDKQLQPSAAAFHNPSVMHLHSKVLWL